MKKAFLCGLGFIALINSASALTYRTEAKVMNRLVGESKRAVWESECSLMMKGQIEVNENKEFKFKLKLYSTSDCIKHTDYLTLERTGTFTYEEPVYEESRWEDYDGTVNTYRYLARQESLKLNMSDIVVKTEDSLLGSAANAVLGMYQGCFGEEGVDTTKECDQSGLAKRITHVNLNTMNFITPNLMIGEFNNDVNIQFRRVE